MNLLVMDMKGDEGCALDIALRAQEAGHEVRYWLPKSHPVGKGLVEKPKEWKESMEWADLIILTGNCDYPEGFNEYFGKGYPIFGTNPKAAELELDRGEGQAVLEYYGIDTLPYQIVDSVQEAIDVIVKTGKPFALKPWGGTSDKAMTHICKDADEGIFTLQRWEAEGLFKGQLMMQECVEGVEIGISGFFGPAGWSKYFEESFEHKKFMNDDYGGNTGEMGTVIRHVTESKLFDQLLKPLTDYLHLLNYVGDCSVNCMVDKKGKAWPLEFTMRLGWPDFCIRQEVIDGDPIEWMLDLLLGHDTLELTKKIVVGVVMAHGDFPRTPGDPPKVWTGFPISYPERVQKHIHFQQVQQGTAPQLVDGKLEEVDAILTAGTYVLIATGQGTTVEDARLAAYSVVDKISWPSNVMARTDIGKRLMEQLPLLHEHGYAIGMRYGSR